MAFPHHCCTLHYIYKCRSFFFCWGVGRVQINGIIDIKVIKCKTIIYISNSEQLFGYVGKSSGIVVWMY